MSDWAVVEWTQARQIVELIGLPFETMPDPEVSPEAFFQRLLKEDRKIEATLYLSQALPRYEAIVWAGRVLHMVRPVERMANWVQADRQLIDAWIDDPNESDRRRAQIAIEHYNSQTPEKLLLQSIFMSGGSISTEDLPPVNPPQESAAYCAFGAILMAVELADHPATAWIKTLEIGEAIAKREGI